MSSLLPLHRLSSLSLELRDFTLEDASCLPPSLTHLYLELDTLVHISAPWSALPRNLLHLHLQSAQMNCAHRPQVGTEFYGMPQRLQTLHVPDLSPSEESVRDLPLSVTSLILDECPMPLDVIKRLHPQLTHLEASSVVASPASPDDEMWHFYEQNFDWVKSIRQ